MTKKLPLLDVWYVNDQVVCNFDCTYCVTKKFREANKGKMWRSPESAARFRKILEWIARQPYRIRLRAQTGGEPLLSSDFLDGVAWISHQPNIEFVEFLTNGSLLKGKLFSEFLTKAKVEKVSLWVTFHHGQITPKELVSLAKYAQEKGPNVVVHGVIFPDNLELLEEFSKAASENAIACSFTLGAKMNGLYPGHSEFPILDTGIAEVKKFITNPASIRALLDQLEPKGKQCGAGNGYVYIAGNGSIYPCSPYDRKDLDKLGSVFDDQFTLTIDPEKSSPCKVSRCSGCKEDYYHLSAYRGELRAEKSLGLYGRS